MRFPASAFAFHYAQDKPGFSFYHRFLLIIMVILCLLNEIMLTGKGQQQLFLIIADVADNALNLLDPIINGISVQE